MNNYSPQYPVLDRKDLVSRDQIRLVSESELSPLDRAELSRLREGEVEYNILVADTPDNRRNIAIKTTYFQMVAYKEGWKFDPSKYRVEFLEPYHPLLERDNGSQDRIFQFRGDVTDERLFPLSPEKRAGFTVLDGKAVRMEDE